MIPLNPLPPGIVRGIRPDGGRVGQDVFRTACYAAARAVSGSIEQFAPDQRSYTNYDYAILRLPTLPYGPLRTVAILCNGAYPLVAFSDDPGNLVLSRRFVEEPDLTEELAVSGFETIPLDLLLAPPSSLSLSELPLWERKEARYGMRYFRSEQIGDVIYNDWD